jgi:hypothetical protein
MIKTRIK